MTKITYFIFNKLSQFLLLNKVEVIYSVVNNMLNVNVYSMKELVLLDNEVKQLSFRTNLNIFTTT